MMRKIELVSYEVDEAMLGSEWDSEKYSIIDFCEVLQELCEEQCLFFEIIPITDSWNGANHDYEHFAYMPNEYKGWNPHWNMADSIPFADAIERYFEELERDLLNQISNDDLTEIPERLREAIMTKRDNSDAFTQKMYQNIYHNLERKDPDKFEKLSKKYSQKAKLSRIFKQIGF